MTTELILHNLSRIEREHNVKILFAAESGSRAWGFASPDSDWDVRFIYVHPLEWYLTVDSGRDVIEVMTDEGFDAAGWDIRKALGLFKRTNLTLYEWLDSPIIYIDNPWLRDVLTSMIPAIFNKRRAVSHYYHMATNRNKNYFENKGVELKRFLYFLRGLLACRYILESSDLPPVSFMELVNKTVTDSRLLSEIENIINMKASGKENDHKPISPLLIDYGAKLEEKIRLVLPNIPNEDCMAETYEELDKLLYTIITHKGL